MKELLDFHRLDELKNFAANIFLKLVIKSRTGIHASIGSHVLWSADLLVSHVLRAVHWKCEIVTTEQIQLGIKVRVQL